MSSTLTYAVGDIHGCDDLLEHMIARINIDAGAVYGGALACLVLDGAADPEFFSVEAE